VTVECSIYSPIADIVKRAAPDHTGPAPSTMDGRVGPLRVELHIAPADAARIFEKYCTTPLGESFVFKSGGVHVSVVKRSPASPTAATQVAAAEPKPKRSLAVHSSPTTVTRLHTKEHYKHLKDVAIMSKVGGVA
jgi:hypothetical protein